MQFTIFDIETNGLLDTPWEPRKQPVSRIHCGVTFEEYPNGEDGCEWRFRFEQKADGEFTNEDATAFLTNLESAECLVGHNIVAFDLPVLERLWGWKPRLDQHILDTRIACQMAFPEHRLFKIQRSVRFPELPPDQVRRHSLAAWGMRLGVLKDDFGKTTDWKMFSPQMLDYCAQDVLVNHKLLRFLLAESGYSLESMLLESQFARVMQEQRANGVKLDTEGAKALVLELSTKRDIVERRLRERFQPWMVPDGQVFVPKRDNKVRGYKKNVPVQKMKLQELKPASRFHVHRCLSKLGWKPEKFNNDGSATVNRSILRELPWEEAHWFAEFEEVNKRIAMLAEGPSAWLKTVGNDDLIHGKVVGTGTRTGRCTHSSPNLAQTPRVGTYCGEQMRALFGPTRPGWVQVGADASGIELRMAASYCGAFDDGQMAQIITAGDIHSEVQAATGLNDRQNAKVLNYSLLYGGSDKRLGQTVAHDQNLTNVSSRQLTSLGEDARAAVMTKLPGLDRLSTAVKAKARSQGWLKNLDGRRIYDSSQHSCLNSLLQGSSAIVMKQACVVLWFWLKERDIPHGFMLNVHDEFQLECPEEFATEIGGLAVESIVKAGEMFKLRCPLDGEFKVGKNWSETH